MASSPSVRAGQRTTKRAASSTLCSDAEMIRFRFQQYFRVIIKRYRYTGCYCRKGTSYIFLANGKITTLVTCCFEICVLKWINKNNLDQLGAARRRRKCSHTARRIIFSRKSNRGINSAALFSMDLNRQYFGWFTSEVAWRFITRELFWTANFA
jgi:hypothetical protein